MKKQAYILALLALTACKTPQIPQMQGADRDKHGCIPSAGYIWSNVRGECIRTFEVGIRLYNTKNPFDSSATYIVFSDDNIHVEAYIPKTKNSIIMRQKTTDTWQGKGYTLRKTATANYVLYKKQQIIYSNEQQL